MKTFEFKEIEEKKLDTVEYSAGCSEGKRSACCTKVCTKCPNTSEEDSSLQAWDKYLEVEAGVLQY